MCSSVYSYIPMGRVRAKWTSLHTAETAMPPSFELLGLSGLGCLAFKFGKRLGKVGVSDGN